MHVSKIQVKYHSKGSPNAGSCLCEKVHQANPVKVGSERHRFLDEHMFCTESRAGVKCYFYIIFRSWGFMKVFKS